jgi:hypothetical protein
MSVVPLGRISDLAVKRDFNGCLWSYPFIPNLRRNVIIGHQLVKADWNRFSPTNAVKRYQYGLIQYPSAREARMNAPAISLK